MNESIKTRKNSIITIYLSIIHSHKSIRFFFFLNDPATPEFSTLPLHDALPISHRSDLRVCCQCPPHLAMVSQDHPRRSAKSCTGDSRWLAFVPLPAIGAARPPHCLSACSFPRSEEHTSELQSRLHLVCRLLLEK